MPFFRKKPVTIEAIQWLGHLTDEIQSFLKCTYFLGEDKVNLRIVTLEGTMMVSVGDWIIKGISNEFYPCKPDIFEKTYEEIKDE